MADVCFDGNLLTALEKTSDSLMEHPHEDVLMKQQYSELLRQEIRGWRKKMGKDQERSVLEAVILLLENPDLIEVNNKKGIYLYLREISRTKYETSRY